MTKPRCGFPAGSPPQKRHPRRHERQKECLWTPNNVTTCGSSSMCMVQAGNWKRNEHAPRPKRGMGLALTNMDLAILSVDICKVFFQNINIKFLLEKYKFWNDLLLDVPFFWPNFVWWIHIWSLAKALYALWPIVIPRCITKTLWNEIVL